ncbi:MAG: hypothetical protein A7315_06205 [Candidatus Altiarchaeales archaeon WOR_SM1_79]|nr:MAG: hypothetical protein A7315_06205 [Candidatus Altiarchaeales archaeon WOR_SM1_79]
MAHLHGLDYINSVLKKIGSSLSCQVTAYHIGGNAMCIYGLKDTTQDTDLVFIDKREINAFENVLVSIGFLRTDEPAGYTIGEPYARYSEIKNTPLDEDFTPGLDVDLFLNNICGKIVFSEGMLSRSVDFSDSGNLSNRLCSKEDIFIFKAVAGRDRDIDDMVVLAESGLDWGLIANEYVGQLPKLPPRINSEFRSAFTRSVSELTSRSTISLPAKFTRKIAKK